MIGPGLHPRSQATFDRTSRWAQNYYRAWGARVRAQREARKLAGAIPDELMNEYSDSDDEKVMQLNLHAPTPVSMPSSPTMAALPKPIDTDMSLKSNIIESKYGRQEVGFSPLDGDSTDPSGWQLASRQSNHQSATRRSSGLVELTASATAIMRSASGAHSKSKHIGSSDSKDPSSRKHSRKSSSRNSTLKGTLGKDGEAGLRHIQCGRIGKRRSCHRELI